MEPIWLKEAGGPSALDRETQWSRNWASSAMSSFSSGLETVRGYQRRRQTLHEVLLVSVLVGILGNVLAQALFQMSEPVYLASFYDTAVPLPVLEIILVLAVMVFVIALYLRYQRKYGPHEPAEVIVDLEYPMLLESYDKDARDGIEYLMTGAGIREFEQYAKRVLTRTIKSVEALPLQSKIIQLKESVREFNDYPPEISLSGELGEVAEKYRLKGVKATLTALLYASRFTRDPMRVMGVTLTVTFSMRNPENSLADEFLLQIVKPLLPYLAEAFRRSFWTELPLSKITALRNLIRRTHEYLRDHGTQDDWYLMNYYPYDGESETMLVIDKSLVKRRPVPDPILETLHNTNLFGCYVTDSDDWISTEVYEQLFGVSHHIIDELIYVDPTRVITIGRKAKPYVDECLRTWPKKPLVVNVLENLEKPIEIDEVSKQLRKELTEKLSGSTP